MSRRRFRWVVGSIVVLLAAAAWWIGLTINTWAGGGPLHEFVLTDPPPFLTEELAVAKARESLSLDGLDPDAYQPYANERTTAPDGRADTFLSRNSNNPNSGSVLFTRNGKAADRFVHVELAGNRVTCRGSWGK